jgi:hypothetical protein
VAAISYANNSKEQAMHRSLAACIVCTFLALPAAAQPSQQNEPAQHDFTSIRLHLGETVFVSDPATGLRVSGPLKSLTPSTLEVGDYRFAPTPRMKVERSGDPVWDGAAYGFGIGGLLGITVGAEGCLHANIAYCFVGNGITFALLGALLDWNHEGRTTVFHGAPNAAGAAAMLPEQPRSATPSRVDLTSLRLHVGDTAAVWQRDGTVTEGRVTYIDPNTIRIDGVTFDASSGLSVERIGDPIWDGAAIGAAVGFTQGIAGGCGASCAGKTAVLYGAIGAMIDYAVSGRKTVFNGTSSKTAHSGAHVRLVPEIGPGRKAVSLAVRLN